MSSVKSWMVGVVAGAAACGSAGVMAQNMPTLVVGKHSQPVQTPTTAPSGAVYLATGAQTSTLTAYTEGFLLCGNIGSEQTSVKLDLWHEDQSPSLGGAHPWRLPIAFAQNFAYNGGRFVVNPGVSMSTLACNSLGKQGEMVSGLNEGIFDNGYDSATETNYNHLINWIPTGFDWNQPDWAQVPKDACISTANQPARVVEDAACAAVSGLRPVTGTTPSSVRAGTIWTAGDAISFTYLFRVDLRYGEQPANAVAEFQLPQDGGGTEPNDSPTGLSFMLVDAYDSKFLSDTGQYCFLTAVPTTLNSSICSGAGIAELNGPMHHFSNVPPPPLSSGSTTFYVAATRQRVSGGSHSDLSTPVVAASVLVEPLLVAEGGNKFSGDDTVFGFMPNSTGFPWMRGGQ